MNYKERIKASGLTIKKVAELIPLHPVNLSYYLNNVKPMPMHVEKRIKEILKAYNKIKV